MIKEQPPQEETRRAAKPRAAAWSARSRSSGVASWICPIHVLGRRVDHGLGAAPDREMANVAEIYQLRLLTLPHFHFYRTLGPSIRKYVVGPSVGTDLYKRRPRPEFRYFQCRQ